MEKEFLENSTIYQKFLISEANWSKGYDTLHDSLKYSWNLNEFKKAFSKILLVSTTNQLALEIMWDQSKIDFITYF